MLKLNKGYYIAIAYVQGLTGRFTNFKDAISSLPEVLPCFGPTLRGGRVFYIDDECPDMFNPKQMVDVFESIEEYYELKKNQELTL